MVGAIIGKAVVRLASVMAKIKDGIRRCRCGINMAVFTSVVGAVLMHCYYCCCYCYCWRWCWHCHFGRAHCGRFRIAVVVIIISVIIIAL